MPRKPKQTRPGAAQPPPLPAQPTTREERARRLLAGSASAALDDEIALQRQINDRLLALWDRLEGADADETPTLQVKVAAALTSGIGRVARLLRDQRALSGQAADGLAGAIAHALDELSTEWGVAL